MYRSNGHHSSPRMHSSSSQAVASRSVRSKVPSSFERVVSEERIGCVVRGVSAFMKEPQDCDTLVPTVVKKPPAGFPFALVELAILCRNVSPTKRWIGRTGIRQHEYRVEP